MWLLLFVPILIVVAIVVLSVSALFAGLFWVLGSAWPVLLIGLGVWMFLRADGRHTRRHHWTNGPHALKTHSAPAHQGHRASRGKRASASQDPRPQAELPIDLQVKVEQIRRKVDVLLGYADRFPPFSQDLYLVRQTASDYLPRTVNTYLALPPQTAEKPLSADGKTAYQELKSQLDLLDSKLDDIAQDLQRQDTDRLLANRRFLEARFGSRSANGVLEPDATGVA
jgi:hypothetical protein